MNPFLRFAVRGVAVLCSILPLDAMAEGQVPADLDAYIAEGMKAWKVPGIAIAVVADGELVLAKGYGVREAGKPEAVDADTLFAIGSTTKAFTSAAIGTLVDAGKLAWDTPVAKFWPEFRLSDPWITRDIRVSDLLANHSGLSLISEALWYGTGHDREEIIRRLQFVPVDEGFRYQFQYRNTMFLAAGQLLAKVEGRSWDDYVSKVFFEPLGMKRTFPTEAGIDEMENVARPHLIDYEGAPLTVPYRNMMNIAPAGSIISCARDMANWVRMQLSRGKFGERQILKPETVDFMHRSQTPLGSAGPAGQPLFPRTELASYCLAWVTESYRGVRTVWHNGGIDGMSAWVGLVPDRGIGVVVLSNLDECDLRKAIFYKIVDAFAEGTSEDLKPGLLQVHAQALKARNEAEQAWQALAGKRLPAELPLERYAGRYSHPALGEVEISLENGALVYRRTPQQSLDLVCSDKSAFSGKYRNAAEDLRSGKVALVFAVDNGMPTSLMEEGLVVYQRVE